MIFITILCHQIENLLTRSLFSVRQGYFFFCHVSPPAFATVLCRSRIRSACCQTHLSCSRLHLSIFLQTEPHTPGSAHPSPHAYPLRQSHFFDHSTVAAIASSHGSAASSQIPFHFGTIQFQKIRLMRTSVIAVDPMHPAAPCFTEQIRQTSCIDAVTVIRSDVVAARQLRIFPLRLCHRQIQNSGSNTCWNGRVECGFRTMIGSFFSAARTQSGTIRLPQNHRRRSHCQHDRLRRRSDRP